MKRNVIVIALVLSCLSLFADAPAKRDFYDLTGKDWLAWSVNQRYFFALGYVLGSWTSIQVLLNNDLLSPLDYQDWSTVAPYHVQSATIAEEMTDFYENTNRLDYPLYIVVYDKIRNSWKRSETLPPWKVVHAEGYWE